MFLDRIDTDNVEVISKIRYLIPLFFFFVKITLIGQYVT